MGTASDQGVHYAHPYYPTSLSLPGYHPLVIPFETILAIFFGGFAAAFLGTWVVSGRFPKLSVGERLLTCWFVCTGIIHLVIEGAVVVNSEFYKDTSGNILNEIWKEYAKADSRYATRDAFTISMEAVTAFIEGPTCFLIAYGILAAKPFRFSAIVLVSLGQLYGDVLYYMTCRHHGWSHHSRPEPLYFWFYFVIVNAIWIVVPLTCIVYAVTHINAAIAKAGPRSGSKSKKKQ